MKSKGKEKEKKKTEEASDELDKKTKKKGFGLLRQEPSFFLFLTYSVSDFLKVTVHQKNENVRHLLTLIFMCHTAQKVIFFQELHIL